MSAMKTIRLNFWSRLIASDCFRCVLHRRIV